MRPNMTSLVSAIAALGDFSRSIPRPCPPPPPFHDYWGEPHRRYRAGRRTRPVKGNALRAMKKYRVRYLRVEWKGGRSK